MQPKKTNKTALVCAVDMLAVRSYSRATLTTKLHNKGFFEDEINTAIQHLVDRGYLDDRELCLHMYQRLIAEEKYSLKQIMYKLLQKGFSETIIKDCSEEDDWAQEKNAALRLLRSKYRAPENIERMVMMRQLYQKGFTRQAIDWAIDGLVAETDLTESDGF